MIYKEICINHSKTGINRNWTCTKEDKLNEFVKKYQNKEVELYTSYYDFNKDLIKHLETKEYEVLRLSYGLDCDKHSANEIAKKLNISGSSSYVRVSQLKKQAVNKLIENVDHSQVIDFL